MTGAKGRRIGAALSVGSILALGAAAASADAIPHLPVPHGCALGIGGPALVPATSLHEARDAAFAALAAERLPTRVTSEVSWRGARVREAADEHARGRLRGVRIAALRGGPGGRVEALACGPEVGRDALGPDWTRAWPRAIGRHAGCALGLAGTDLDPGLRARAARRDALEMLARTLEADVQHALSVRGGRRVKRAHLVRATDAAREATRDAVDGVAERRWLDHDGRGPLRRPGVLYVELCLPSAAPAPPPRARPPATPPH